MLFPNIAQAHRGVAYAVTATYKRRTCHLAKTESEGSENAVKSALVGPSSLLPRTITYVSTPSVTEDGHFLFKRGIFIYK